MNILKNILLMILIIVTSINSFFIWNTIIELDLITEQLDLIIKEGNKVHNSLEGLILEIYHRLRPLLDSIYSM